MKKKILIICDMFPPAFAPRMGYLCKYLEQSDWEATVVTEYIQDKTFTFLSGYAPTTYIQYYKGSNTLFKHLEWLWIMFLDFLFHYKERKMAKRCRRLIQKNHFNGILCSTYRSFPLPVAQRLSQQYNLPLIVDLRDIIEQYSANEYISHKIPYIPILSNWFIRHIRKKLLKERNNVLQVADCAVTVSPWHIKILQQYNTNTKLIYNGFDSELFYPKKIKTNRFFITYTGRIISQAIQDPTLLLKAISTLSQKGIIHPDTIRVQWFTNKSSREIITSLAHETEVDLYMDYFDYVPASEVPDLLNNSSILLSLTNKSEEKGPKGILGTKFFEYLAVEKPILCVRSDESCLAEAIKETNAGLAATDVDEVCRFILFHYNEWKEKGYTSSSVNREKIQMFSRKEQAKQFVQIFENVCNHG